MLPTTPHTRRRWCQFGLRTLLVAVTFFALWLGWEMHYIRERRVFLASNREVIAAGPKRHLMMRKTQYKPAEIPLWRRWLGDEAVDVIQMPFAAGDEVHIKARALFQKPA